MLLSVIRFQMQGKFSEKDEDIGLKLGPDCGVVYISVIGTSQQIETGFSPAYINTQGHNNTYTYVHMHAHISMPQRNKEG